ncbi:2-amino-4-hydroxy-6-hydroxymethyldihydropteridine diphosphokinase [Hoyosella sp. G463]|uniref:2-amino-4-hydroxy-6-hydroxymethyldihydropteridine diphosphokinase n=1 Tax=Lolliginicoccus lacisalsi TaxID=2742202 RepID=A0A927PLM2_9ACTN|nr:2-amino-4-hydroxy-6-hydroxymethyldihydropteridine diphosphokinase [Lolliginicoccus lacisalsi]MBD8507290.1 2-amino-4-hydroxy-6-hydroxymethyldihydropteridine diphosphokinase [Lolliginicoccus lacisalsi]
MTVAVLSIGSNIGDRRAHLESVVDALGERLIARSRIYETPPWGGVEQEPFLNAILLAEDSDWLPDDWLALAQRCEGAADRVRDIRWGPRTLDVDIVTCHDADGEIRSGDPRLTLPHPRAHERAFVLVPWAQARPGASLGGIPVTELLDRLPAAEVQAVRPLDPPRGW